MDSRDFYIFGEPIDTKFGKIRFLTYKEYLLNLSELSLISQNVLHLYYMYRKQFEKEKNSKELIEELNQYKKKNLYEIVLGTDYILEAYLKILLLVLDTNEYSDEEFKIVIDAIFSTEEDFMYIRNMIMDMQVLTEDDVSPNEEIQKAIERSRRVKQHSSDKQSFVDIVTSITASTNNSFEDVCNMTVFQVYATYARISAIFNYNTTTLFATVAEKVSIEAWNKHINLFEKKTDTLTQEEFKSQFGGLFDI